MSLQLFATTVSRPMRILLILLCLQPALLSAAPRVVASIAPVYEVAAAVMDGIGKPDVVIDSHASAHHFAFKPSDMKMLQAADLVIWVDRHFEAGFARIDEFLPKSTARLELLPALGAGEDGHFWYSPQQLITVIELTSNAIAELDPPNREDYLENAFNLARSVDAWRQRIVERWQNQRLRILTDHAFLEPFAKEFPYFDVESIHDHHDAHGGLQDLNRVEKWLGREAGACLLTLEVEPSPLAKTLAVKHDLDWISISASDSTPAMGDILTRLEDLESALEHCAGH